MSHLLDEILAQAANGSPATVALSAESATVLLFAAGFLEVRNNWLDKSVDPLDEVTDADWDEIEKLVGNLYEALMTPLVGQIMPLMMTSVPANMLLCDGSTHLRVDYPELYAVIDSFFIVDADHFKVPNLLGRVPIGAGSGFGLPTYAFGVLGGEYQHAITINEMPLHNHAIVDPGHTHGERIGNSPAYLGATGSTHAQYQSALTGSNTQVLTDSRTTGITTDNEGGGLNHTNMQPYQALTWAVVAY